LGIECGYSCLGQSGRANATIGRALRLVMRNVGGAIPGAVSKSVFGQPGRVSLCFGEWEERSPWPPFHVRRGFARADSVVTAACARSRSVPERGGGRRVGAPRALLLHLRPHLVGEQALHARRGVRRR